MAEDILKLIFSFAGAMAVLGCVTGIVVTFIKRRGALPSREISARLAEVSERLSRLENAVDASAVEIERISEGQRFTTKLLSDNRG